jgi:hypothetical protein
MLLAFRALVFACLCWLPTSSLWIYPHSLSYFNESIAGPLNGPMHLLGSNVDWGQDFEYKHGWSESNGVTAPWQLSYRSGYNPVYLTPVLSQKENRNITSMQGNVWGSDLNRNWYFTSWNIYWQVSTAEKQKVLAQSEFSNHRFAKMRIQEKTAFGITYSILLVRDADLPNGGAESSHMAVP